MRRFLSSVLVMVGAVLFVLSAAGSASAHGYKQMRIHVNGSDQYLYTHVNLPDLTTTDVQAALSGVTLTFGGQLMTVDSVAIDTNGTWEIEVDAIQPIVVGDNLLTLEVMNPVPATASLNVVVVERHGGQWPVCDAWVAAWQGPHSTACVVALESPVVEPPTEPTDPPSPVDTTPVTESPKQTQTIQPALPATPPVVEPPILAIANTSPAPRVPQKKPANQPSVLGDTSSTGMPTDPTPERVFRITPVTAMISVAAGLGVAGAAALIADKLGLIKPKP